jgi:hypothetical protein
MGTVYYITLTARRGSPTSLDTKTVSLTASDTAGEFWLQPSGSSEIFFGTTSPVYITDILVSSSAGTTKNFQTFVGGASIIDSSALANFVGTVFGRPTQQNPLKLGSGSAGLKFKQLA